MEQQGEDIKSITVHVAGRPYPLKISVTDEIVIRRIVKEVNDKVNHFQLSYTNKDKQDCLAMALLTYAVDLYKSSHEFSQDPDLASSLSRLEDLLDALVDE
ncbi:MAG: cell division protein ZapA [Saprospiraceae bacterium]|nr:cell division protein ZapA [Saprospiraceae bacterium]